MKLKFPRAVLSSPARAVLGALHVRLVNMAPFLENTAGGKGIGFRRISTYLSEGLGVPCFRSRPP